MLKLQPTHTVMDAISQLEKMDTGMLQQLMTVHEPSGLMVLPAPLEPTSADQVSGGQMAQLVEMVSGFAGHVIVDLPAIFNEVVLSIIEVSDEIVLVAGLDIPEHQEREDRSEHPRPSQRPQREAAPGAQSS